MDDMNLSSAYWGAPIHVITHCYPPKSIEDIISIMKEYVSSVTEYEEMEFCINHIEKTSKEKDLFEGYIDCYIVYYNKTIPPLKN